jgi:hypothetical protein
MASPVAPFALARSGRRPPLRPDVDTPPDLIAQHDQAQAEVKQHARVVGAYLIALLSEGVEEYEALRLTLAFQRRLLFPNAQVGPADGDSDIE